MSNIQELMPRFRLKIDSMLEKSLGLLVELDLVVKIKSGRHFYFELSDKGEEMFAGHPI